MSDQQRGMHGTWAGRWTFILAATGSAVGLGNLWKFPYITGENGGGAFVLVYLACICAAGMPVMLAEVLLGRRGRMSPINTMKAVAAESGAPKLFQGIGWMGAVSGFFILSFYSVIAGWALAYVIKLASGDFVGTDGAFAEATFGGLISDPIKLTVWHTVFMIMTGWVIARGVNKGLESTLKVLMPLLFVLMLVLFGYSLSLEGFSQGFHFLFDFDFSKLTGASVIEALGHAFFTLSLGMGAIMAYGAYMPKDQSLSKTVFSVAILDTLVALIAGLIIFAIVFTNNLQPDDGPGLMFKALPLAFGSLDGGVFFGTVFFVLVAFAAWSSAMSIAEPAVAWAVEKGKSRTDATIFVCGLAWLIGLGTVLSFNEWGNNQILVSETFYEELLAEDGSVQDKKILDSNFHFYADVSELGSSDSEDVKVEIKGKTFFDALDFLTASVMLPLGGLLIAIFVGWFASKEMARDEAKFASSSWFQLWYLVLRYLSPFAILAIFVHKVFF